MCPIVQADFEFDDDQRGRPWNAALGVLRTVGRGQVLICDCGVGVDDGHPVAQEYGQGSDCDTISPQQGDNIAPMPLQRMVFGVHSQADRA
jgi:hypothetical protein